MNVLLTEIRSLNLDLSGLAEVAPDAASNFTRLFQQQLSENPEFGSQTVEYKGIYTDLQVPLEASGEALELPQAVAWRDYLAQDPVRVSSDSDPLQATPVNLELIAAPAAAQAPQSVAMARAIGGESLPRGGKTLPDAGLAPLISGSVRMQTGVAASAPVPVLNPQDMAAEMNLPDPAGTRATAAVELPAQIRQRPAPAASPGGAIDNTNALRGEIPPPEIRDAAKIAAASDPRTPALQTSLEKPVITAAAAAMSQPRSAPESGAQPPAGAVLRRQSMLNSGVSMAAVEAAAVQSKPALEIPPVAQQPQAAAGARPAPAALAAASQSATAVDSAQPVQRNPVNPELSMPRASAPGENLGERAGMNPERWTGPNKSTVENLTLRPAAVAADTTAAGESREINRIQLTQPTQSLEPGQAQNPAVRAEPVPNLTAPTAPAAGVASSMAATPLAAAQVVPAAGEGLPPQLEVLQLSRQADANDWSNGLGERVQWMVNQKQNSAMIRLDPPALGKLDVQVKVTDDSTTITIQTQHAQTRDLIETASHRLRDFLQESGYQNVNVDVSQRHDQQQARAQTAAAGGDEAGGDADAEPGADDSILRREQDYLQGDGLLDTFA